MKKINIIILSFVFLLDHICFGSSLESFLKNIKTDHNDTKKYSMKNIDFIYMINLDTRPEKFKKSLKLLKKYSITPYRFSAINGNLLSVKEIESFGIKSFPDMLNQGSLGNIYSTTSLNKIETITKKIENDGHVYFCSVMKPGAFGCLLSHLSILKDAFLKNYETIWIMEDDIDIIKNPHIISELITDLDSTVGKENWDILYTDKDTRYSDGKPAVPQLSDINCILNRPDIKILDTETLLKRKLIGNNFVKIKARYGTYSMILRRSGIIKILSFYQNYKIFNTYDGEFIYIQDLNTFTSNKNIVGHELIRVSDICI
jgi:GR25 family glycosyltransferase involved in LPS biosynthesis